MTVTSKFQARNDLKELRLLFEVSHLLVDLGRYPEARLQKVLATLTRHTALMRGLIALTGAGRLEVAAEIGPDQVAGESGPLGRFGGGALNLAAETGRVMIKLKVSDDPLFLTQANLRDLAKERLAFLYVPIKREASSLGVLVADRLFAESVPLEEDLRLLTILADLLAEALAARRDFELSHKVILADNQRLKELLSGGHDLPPLLGQSTLARAAHDLLRQLAPNDFNVLITGEFGTGKKLAARHLHALSGRSNGPFFKIACAALKPGAAAAALFGSPLTGAEGHLRSAKNGTVYLAGLDGLSPESQARLAALLDGATFAQVGGVGQDRLTARLVAATEFTKEDLIERGRLRPDLADRLSKFSLRLPPLRDCRQDLPILADHFLNLWSREYGLKPAELTPEACQNLADYTWPGNIQELSLVVARGAGLAQGGFIGPEHLPGLINPDDLPSPGLARLSRSLNDLERQMVIEALEAENGHMSKAAARLGMSKRVMGLRMKKYGLDFKPFRLAAKLGGESTVF